ncbi:MAG: M48 family metalloprotease [bacterium]
MATGLLYCAIGYALVGFISAVSLIALNLYPVDKYNIYGIAIGLIFWGTLVLYNIRSGDKTILANSGAKKVTHNDFPRLFNVIEEMKIASGLNIMPGIYVVNDPSPNAFSTRKNSRSASIVVTSGILSKLSRNELQGVIAHEIAHIKNNDSSFIIMLSNLVWFKRLTDGIFVANIPRMPKTYRLTVHLPFMPISNRITVYTFNILYFLCWGLFFLATKKIIFILIWFLVWLLSYSPEWAQWFYSTASKRREYIADAYSVFYTRDPQELICALKKIDSSQQGLYRASALTAPLYIVNPYIVREKIPAIRLIHR